MFAHIQAIFETSPLLSRFAVLVTLPQAALPLSVLAGRGDSAEVAAHLAAWQEESSQSCQVQWFEGDHCFVQSAQAAVLCHVAGALAPLLRACGAEPAHA